MTLASDIPGNSWQFVPLRAGRELAWLFGAQAGGGHVLQRCMIPDQIAVFIWLVEEDSDCRNVLMPSNGHVLGAQVFSDVRFPTEHEALQCSASADCLILNIMCAGECSNSCEACKHELVGPVYFATLCKTCRSSNGNGPLAV